MGKPFGRMAVPEAERRLRHERGAKREPTRYYSLRRAMKLGKTG